MENPSLKKRLQEEPWVPIGAGATAVVLLGGLHQFTRGNSIRGQHFMRARVFAQLATVLGIGAGAAWAKTHEKPQVYEDRIGLQYDDSHETRT